MQKQQYTVGHCVRIVLAMGWSDFCLKFRGSIAGYFWSFSRTLLRFVVILYVVQQFIGESVPYYPLYLFLGLIVWEYFTETVEGCMAMLFQKKAMIQRIPMPRILLMLSAGWTSTIIFITHLLIFVVLLFLFGAPLSLGVLYFPIVLVQMLLLFLSMGMILSSYALRFRDMQQLWAVLQQMLFWLTPIFYPYLTRGPLAQELLELPSTLQEVSLRMIFDIFVRFQPVAVLLHDARRSLLYYSETGMPSLFHASILTLLCVTLFAFALVTFHRRSRHFLEEY